MKIYDIVKCLSGNVLGIGVDEKITQLLEQNERILNCNLLNSQIKSGNYKSPQKSSKMHLFFTNKQKKFAFVVTDSASRGSYVIYEHSKAENMSEVRNFGCGKYQNDTKSDFVIFLTKNPSFYPPNNYQ